MSFMTPICNWNEVEYSEGEESLYETDCGKNFVVHNGSPDAFGMKFCCYCGERLIETNLEEDTAFKRDADTLDMFDENSGSL